MISQDTIEKSLKQSIVGLENINNRQAFNSRSVVLKKTITNTQYDHSAALVANSYNYLFKLTATTASGRTTGIKMLYWYTWDMPNVMANATNHSNMPGRSLMYSCEIPQDGTLSWVFNARCDGSPHTLYVKFGFWAADDVTFNITVL